MTVALHILEAMEASGCTAAQILAVLRADAAERIRRRCARAIKAALFPPAADHVADVAKMVDVGPAAKMNDHDSGVVVEPDSDRPDRVAAPHPDPLPEGAREAVSAPERPGHVHNGSRKTVARAALLAHPGLRPAARRVAAQLVEYCNLETERCDPAIGTLADKCGISARSVSRALRQLSDAGLLTVHVHGGRYHANAYRLDWAALARLAPGAAAPPGVVVAASTTPVSAEHDSRVMQTLNQNPEQTGGGRRHRRARPKRGEPQPMLPLMVVHTGGQGIGQGVGGAAGDRSYGQAGQRLWGDICRHADAEMRRRLLDLVDADPGLNRRATFAEVREPGSGLGVLLAAVGPDGRGAAGTEQVTHVSAAQEPPKAVSG